MPKSTLSHCRPEAKHDAGDCALCDHYEIRFNNKNYRFPHCDAYTLHIKGICEFCDDYASDMQEWREQNGVNFTGEDDPSKKPCPATTRRKASTIHQWYGNIPMPKSCSKCGAVAVYIHLALGCPKHGPV